MRSYKSRSRHIAKLHIDGNLIKWLKLYQLFNLYEEGEESDVAITRLCCGS